MARMTLSPWAEGQPRRPLAVKIKLIRDLTQTSSSPPLPWEWPSARQCVNRWGPTTDLRELEPSWPPWTVWDLGRLRSVTRA